MSGKDYWAERTARAQAAITDKNIKQIERQMRKYYKTAMHYIIDDFERTHNKILKAVENGKEPTPADLYKLDKYWQMQGQMQAELKKLGAKQLINLARVFEINYFEIYHSINIDGLKAYNTLDKEAVQQMINQIWVADGQSWSNRVWQNTEYLAQTLNEELIQCVTTGKTTSELKEKLQERFAVSYSNADMIARTELSHIQTQAARQRYEDYGIKQVEVWADKDERRCKQCGKLHQTKYFVTDKMPVPVHPRCRCSIIPVIDELR